MYDLLETHERNAAHEQGWDVFYVYDQTRERWLLAPLPLTFSPSIGATQVMNHVISKAQFRDSLCIKVLRMCTHFRPHSTPRKKK